VNLNYDKIKARQEEGSGNHWTSYSDLFLTLSVVFLLMFVIANLRSGTSAIHQQAVNQKLQQEAEELRKQIKVYENLRDDYVQKDASRDEIQVYQELMGKLSLLEGEAKVEREKLFKQAKDAQEKERSLNKYQALVKNIITANLVSKSKVKQRDQIIENKETVIAQQDEDINDLNKQVLQRESQIADNTEKISQIQTELEKQINEVKYAYRSKQNAKVKLETKIAQLREASETKIAALNQENSQAVGRLRATQAELETKNREAERLLNELGSKESQYHQAISELGKAHAQAVEREKRAFEEGTRKAQLTGEAKLAQERAYREAVEAKNKLYNDKLAALNGQLVATQQNISALEGKYQGTIKSLEKTNEALGKGLAASNAKLNEQRLLAERIAGNLRRAGVPASVDGKTGDVTINFQNEYFDTGSANLKPGMQKTLESFFPAYARSLFQDPKVAEKLSNVEIVGFASPTYKGKFVDPDSLAAEDRQAVNYNMDLSYQRAKSIFEHIFDQNKMQFENQKRLLPLVKVTGRSYLATERGQDGRGIASQDDYCRKYDCKKSQRVIIKFNLRDE
jgi:myosin heavy subunit